VLSDEQYLGDPTMQQPAQPSHFTRPVTSKKGNASSNISATPDTGFEEEDVLPLAPKTLPKQSKLPLPPPSKAQSTINTTAQPDR